MRIVTVAAQKGGVAKTTTAFALASLWAAKSGFNVLLVDLDEQGSSRIWADQVEDLPFEYTAPDAAMPVDRLGSLRSLPYDVIVIDTPPKLGDERLLKVLSVSDFVVVPTLTEGLAVVSLITTIDQVVRPSGVPFRVLLSKVEHPAHAAAARQTLEARGVPMFATAVRKYVVHANAVTDGRVVTQFGNADVNARADFTDVAMELFALWGTETNSERLEAGESDTVDLRDQVDEVRRDEAGVL